MAMRTRAGTYQQLMIVLGATGLAVAVALAVAVDHRSGSEPVRDVAVAPKTAASPPAIPPALFADEAPDRARASNALVPLAAGPPLTAHPFRYAGTPVDRASAEACLAAAAIYEAGDDREGEQAVVQVILNRLRHPAFPKSVCGVVFQGSERQTGCQFTFTCDGALSRVPPPQAWERARRIAREALDGFVFAPVGTATHYHADWVVPYWRSSLEKIAVVHTQIFYRWHGWWGSPVAFTGRLQPGEPLDARVAALAGIGPTLLDPDSEDSDAHLPARQSLAVTGVPTAALHGSIVRLKDEEAGQYVLQLNPSGSAASFVITAFTLCGGRDDCLVLGWTNEAQVPHALPVLPFAMRSLAFVYRKSSVLGIAQPHWDCARYPRPLPSQCLPKR